MSKQDLSTGNTEGKNFACYVLGDDREISNFPFDVDITALEPLPWIKRFWIVDIDNREDLQRFLIAASIEGAQSSQVLGLILKWKITDDDAILYCKEHNLEWNIDGDQFVVHAQSFINLHDSNAGFGSSLFEAVCDFFTQEAKQ